MGLSDLTNKELKNILRQNNVKNYSKFNKKDLVKMVNQLINAQNGGKNEKINNGKKKYKLKELIGGEPPEILQPLLSKNNRNKKNSTITNNTIGQESYKPPSAKNIPITNSEKQAFLQKQQQEKLQQEQPQQEQPQQEKLQQEQPQQEQPQQEQPKNNSANNSANSGETIVNNQEKCKSCTIL